MNKHNEHINNSSAENQSKTFLSGGKFTWKKSNEAIWSELESKLETKPAGGSLSLNFSFTKWAIAASFLIIIGVGSFLRFYQLTIETPAGQHHLAELPDGSTVNLNAESTLKYNPYWWKYKREIKFEGEAFFEVEKGKQFTVNSSYGTTQVLGTSFNIFAREEVYKVTCITGSVRVISSSKKTATLVPNSKAEIGSDGNIEVQTEIEPFPEISWKRNIFLFTASPLREVFFELERQFGIKITTRVDSYALYTGNFTRSPDIEEVLGYICPALGLDFIRKSATEFEIIHATE